MATFYEYPKIPALYERKSDGSKLLDETKFSRDIFEFLAYNEWVATEKLDGTNIGIVWDGHKVKIQGRTADTSFSAVQFEYLTEKFGGGANEELFEQHFGEKPVVLYGELVGKGIQACGAQYCPSGYRFYLFDVYFPGNNLWANQAARKTFAGVFDVEAAPNMVSGTLEDLVDYVKALPKSYCGDLVAEGVVARPVVEMFDNQGKRVITKIKVCDFVGKEEIKAKNDEYHKGI